MDYLNNFSVDKIYYDTKVTNQIIQAKDINNKVMFALDTENTNKDNKLCITYATQLMEFGTVLKGGVTRFTKEEDRVMLLFTHPDKFWEYVHEVSYQNIELYLFNAEYDVNNLLNFAINKYGLKEVEPDFESLADYDGLYEDKTSNLSKTTEYTYKKISRNGKIYKCDIQLGAYQHGKTKGVKKIQIFDMAKKLTGTLKANVESFTPLKMNKDDLDYTKFRDFGHREYSTEELLYMWNDVYCLASLTMEYLYSGTYKHTDKLTTSSMALANYKDELCEDFKEAVHDKRHPLYHLAIQYVKYCRKVKIAYALANADDKKYTKLANAYYEYCMLHGEENDTDFIIDNFFEPKDVFNFIFPSVDYDIFDFVSPSYCGGITRFHHKKDVGKWLHGTGMGVDINSSFPYSYTTFKLPYGKGIHHKNVDYIEFEEDKLYIIKFTVTNFKTKKNKEPNISKVMIGNKNLIKDLPTWVDKFNGTCCITCTSTDFTYFTENYSYDDLQINEYIEYKSTNGLFNRFTNKFYGIKSDKSLPKAIRTWVKLILNGVYGKFGQNKCAELRQDVYDSETNSINEEIIYDEDNTVEILSEGVYIPLASFVTSYSRIHLLEVLNIINATKGIDWKYCDTDSSYVIGDIDILKNAIKDYIDLEDTGELGKWKIEKYFSKMLVIGIKKYIYYGNEIENVDYSYHCTLSGINKKYFSFIEEYCKVNENCICPISSEDTQFIKSAIRGDVPYYVSRETNNPFIYRDKECTEMVLGAYRSIRKKTVTNGQILYNTIYSIKGEL